MSNILSVNASAPFSAQSLDANSAASDELDPRFVEELQGAMGLAEPESTPQSAANDASSPQADVSDNDETPSLQNLPLMPWAMIHMPANFAPQGVANTGDAGDSRAVDALTSASAVEAGVVDASSLTTVSGMLSMGGAAGTVAGANLVANGTAQPASPGAAQGVADQGLTAVASQAPTGASASGAMPRVPVATVSPSLIQREEVQSADVDTTQANAPTSTPTPVEPAVASQVAVTSMNASGTTPDTAVMPSTAGSRQQDKRVVAAGAVANAEAPVVAEPSTAMPSDQIDLSNVAPSAGVSAQTRSLQDHASVTVSQSVTPEQTPSSSAALATAVSTGSVADASTQHATINDTPTAQLTQTSDHAVTNVATSTESDASTGVETALERTVSQPVTAAGASAVTVSAQRVAAATTDATVQVAAAGASAETRQGGAVSQGVQHLDGRDGAWAQAAQERTDTQIPDVSADTAITVPATAVSVTSSMATSSQVEVAKAEPSPTTSSTLAAMSAHKGQMEFARGDGAETLSKAASSEAPAASSLTLNGSTLDVLGAGPSARTGSTAESTFASSFVQALMGHAHPPVAPHSQALEVLPAPAPIAPHQVRFDAGQVQVEVVRLVKQGGGQVVMELTPPDESKFKIDLSINQQGVARLVVDGASESTRLRLEQTVSGLQDQFQQMGLQLQLDMRQPRQHEAHTQPDASTTPDAPGAAKTSRPDTVALQPITGRPAWEQGQVYLVA